MSRDGCIRKLNNLFDSDRDGDQKHETLGVHYKKWGSNRGIKNLTEE